MGLRRLLSFACCCRLRGVRDGHGACVLKAPWSGSGKLNWCKGTFPQSIEGWCDVSSKRGFVSGEPAYHKIEDFAMEFCSDGCGKVSFVGYSLFSADKSGAYSGNLLMPSQDMKNTCGICSSSDVARCAQQLLIMLSDDMARLTIRLLGVDTDGMSYAGWPLCRSSLCGNQYAGDGGWFTLHLQEHIMAPGKCRTALHRLLSFQ